jgi:hypothetical protein
VAATLVALVLLILWWLGRPVETGPMVQMLEPDGFTLVWQTTRDDPMTVRISDPAGAPAGEYTCTPTAGRCEVTADGLTEGTEYRYEIVFPDRRVFAAHTARTAPPRGEPFRFLAFGDSGSGDDVQYDLARLMPKYDPLLVIHTGDLIYMEGAARDYPKKFYRPYADLIVSAAFYPVVGNHDWDDYQAVPMFDNFVLPRNGPAGTIPERHYWFDVGDVRFVAFDSDALNESLRDDVAPWLDEVLTGADGRWKVVFFHHAVFTHSKHTPNRKVLELIVPLLDKHQVDLVCVGHNHLYERTHPIRDGQIAPDGTSGTVYLTTGAGGGSLYARGENPPAYMAVQVDLKYSFTLVDVSPERLAVQQIGMQDAVLDSFEIVRAPGGEAVPAATGPASGGG